MDNGGYRVTSSTVAVLPQLRFVKRDGVPVLQQAHSVVTFDEQTIHTTSSVEWRDVPMVEE